MGLFGSIGKAIGGVVGGIVGTFIGGPVSGTAAGATIGAGLLGGAGDMLDTDSANHNARSAARDAYQASSKSYRTRYQVTVADMKRAGINPIMAATGGFSVGGAPVMQAPQVFNYQPSPDYASSAKSLAEAGRVPSEVELNSAKAAEAESASRLNAAKGMEAVANAEKAAADVVLALQKVQESVAETRVKDQAVVESMQRVNESIERAKLAAKETEVKAAEMQRIFEQVKTERASQAEKAAAAKQLEKLGLEIDERKKLVMDERAKLAAQMPKLRNQAEVYSTPAGRAITAIDIFIKSLSPFTFSFGGK